MSSHPTGGWTQWDSCSEPPSMCPCRCDHSLHCWRHTFLTRGGRVVSFLKECADTDITVWHPGKHWGVLTVTPQASATCRCNGERVATASPAPPQEGLLQKLVTREIKIPPHLEKDSPSTTGSWWPTDNSLLSVTTRPGRLDWVQNRAKEDAFLIPEAFLSSAWWWAIPDPNHSLATH